MSHTAINVALFAAILAAMVGIQVKDTEDLSRQEQHKKEMRFQRAAAEMCGNGVAGVDSTGAVICTVRKALKAGKATL